MYKLNTITLLLLSWSVSCLGQQNFLKYTSTWQAKPAFGVNFPLTKLSRGEVTDFLIEYNERTFYWQIISGAYFFKKHWGVDLNIQGSTSAGISKRDHSFVKAIQIANQDNYFATTTTGASYNGFSILGGNVTRSLVGLIYRLETDQIVFYPKVSLGLSSFHTDWGKTYLKEQNTNKVLEIYYDPGKIARDLFTLAPAATVGYRVSKRVFANLDLNTTYIYSNINYIKVTTDLTTDQRREDNIPYKKHIFQLGVGTGLTVIIN